MIGPIWLVLASGLLLSAFGEDGGSKDYARFEGIWRFELVEVEGAKQPAVPFETNKIIIGRDGHYIVVQGPRITRGVFRLDSSKSPKHFDITIGSGPIKGRTSPCIYELSDDTYRLCLPLSAKERPTAFVSKPGSGLMLQVLKREKVDLNDVLAKIGRQELAGTWQAVSYALDGNKATEDQMSRTRLVFDAEGNGAASLDGKVFIAAKTKIDPLDNPPAIDFSYVVGDFKGQTSLGIYEVENDKLSICRALPGKPRPTKFESTAGSGLTLMTYSRVKPATDK